MVSQSPIVYPPLQPGQLHYEPFLSAGQNRYFVYWEYVTHRGRLFTGTARSFDEALDAVERKTGEAVTVQNCHTR